MFFFILHELIYGGFSKSSFEFMQFLLPSIYFVFLRRNLVKFVNFATAFIPGHHLIQYAAGHIYLGPYYLPCLF